MSIVIYWNNFCRGLYRSPFIGGMEIYFLYDALLVAFRRHR
jgi:hypothetical protein